MVEDFARTRSPISFSLSLLTPSLFSLSLFLTSSALSARSFVKFSPPCTPPPLRPFSFSIFLFFSQRRILFYPGCSPIFARYFSFSRRLYLGAGVSPRAVPSYSTFLVDSPCAELCTAVTSSGRAPRFPLLNQSEIRAELYYAGSVRCV